MKKTSKKVVRKVAKTVKPLTKSEIRRIATLHGKNKSQRFIANDIGRSRSAVFYQIHKQA